MVNPFVCTSKLMAVTKPIPTTDVTNLYKSFKLSSSFTISIIFISTFFRSLSIAAKELLIVFRRRLFFCRRLVFNPTA
jgi:hypothetical protein